MSISDDGEDSNVESAPSDLGAVGGVAAGVAVAEEEEAEKKRPPPPPRSSRVPTRPPTPLPATMATMATMDRIPNDDRQRMGGGRGPSSG